jgi:K+/H+ antiporter YhaU regulatory subunit KhtT
LFIGFTVTRVGTVALTFTGLSREFAHFQSRSAWLGVGFTTREAEQIMEHPVRRRIIMLLMLGGNAGFVAAIASLMQVFIGGGGSSMSVATRLLGIASALLLLLIVSMSKWVDHWMSRAIGWALKKWTRLEVWDFPSLLQLSSGYTVTELGVEAGDWLAGKPLSELRLTDEGVQVLGIRRADGNYLGAPMGKTYIRRGDTLIVYGRVEQIAELHNREAGATGDMAHEMRVQQQQMENKGEEPEAVRNQPRHEAAETPTPTE